MAGPAQWTLAVVDRLRDKATTLARGFVGRRLDGFVREEFFNGLASVIGMPDEQSALVADLVGLPDNGVVDGDYARRAGMLVAGWSRLLPSGMAPFRWAGRPAAWHMVEVVDTCPRVVPSKGGRPDAGRRIDVSMRLLWGPGTGLTLVESIPEGLAWALLDAAAGGSRKPGRFPEDIFGMRFTAILERSGSMLMVRSAQADSTQTARNRKLQALRKAACRFQDDTGHAACRPCGLGADMCPAARMATTWPVGLCLSGHEARVGPQGLCLWCARGKRHYTKE